MYALCVLQARQFCDDATCGASILSRGWSADGDFGSDSQLRFGAGEWSTFAASSGKLTINARDATLLDGGLLHTVLPHGPDPELAVAVRV